MSAPKTDFQRFASTISGDVVAQKGAGGQGDDLHSVILVPVNIATLTVTELRDGGSGGTVLTIFPAAVLATSPGYGSLTPVSLKFGRGALRSKNGQWFVASGQNMVTIVAGEIQ